MAYGKKATTYVDVQADGKAVPLDLLAVCDRVGIKGMSKRIDAYNAKKAEATAMLDAMLADVEQAMDKAGTLDANMALAPWFNYGNRNVVRVFGPRHGQKHAAPKAATSVSSVEQLFGGIAKVSRGIARR
jgi:hypothetical protein